jgi:hypothetical protein
LHRGISGADPVLRLHRELPAYQFGAAVGQYDVDQAGVWGHVSAMEVEATRRRSMEQRRTRAAAGQWMAGLKPYWLQRDNQTRKAVIIPERAYAVLQTIMQYAGGVPISEVAKWMSDRAPIRSGHPTWSTGRLRQLFRNPALWGDLAHGRTLVVTEQRGGETVVVGRRLNPDAIPSMSLRLSIGPSWSEANAKPLVVVTVTRILRATHWRH